MKYKTIVADPPWPYKNPGEFTTGNTPIARGAGADARYATLDMHKLFSMDVQELADNNAHLYLWVTNAFLTQAHDLCREWGFRPITMLTWVKTTESPIKVECPGCKELGCPCHNQQDCPDMGDAWRAQQMPVGVVRASGRTGYYFRGATEHCLFGVRGSLKLLVDEALPTAWLWPRKGQHSAKPDAFYDFVQMVSPEPYLELFARRNRLGWDTWGDESLKHAEIVMGEGEENVVPISG